MLLGLGSIPNYISIVPSGQINMAGWKIIISRRKCNEIHLCSWYIFHCYWNDGRIAAPGCTPNHLENKHRKLAQQMAGEQIIYIYIWGKPTTLKMSKRNQTTSSENCSGFGAVSGILIQQGVNHIVDGHKFCMILNTHTIHETPYFT